jgi:ferritin-like metal-binding protein YciE
VSERSVAEQLDKYLADVHSIEEQALTQLRRAPDIAGDDRLAAVFDRHLAETSGHEDRIRRRLEARGAEASTVKDLAGQAGGLGMVAFAQANPDTPGKLTAHAFSYEHMEIAAYELLRRVAERAGDLDTVEVSHRNLEDEHAMAMRLAECFDVAVAASLSQVEPGDLDNQLVRYLVDAHAIEQQAEQLLTKGPELVDGERLAEVFEQHLEETRGHSERIEARLDEHNAKPSRSRDVALRGGGLGIGAFLKAQPDTTAKLGGFAFAFEHLEIAAYELLRRVAERASDQETARVADAILAEERAAADRIAALWDHAIEAGLRERGVVGEAGAAQPQR